RHGERWARLWMDAVHFAETHGHDQDRIRTNAWPYRDYLIQSFNADKPYAQFVQEQVAGDALFPDDPQAIVALGFLASGPWDESSLRDIREDTLDRQIARYLDRDDVVTTVMQTFTSTTVQCARCHDHKFDPISQRDYYSLQAVFAGVDKANRYYDPDRAVHQRRQELLGLQKRVERSDRTLLFNDSTAREIAAWEERQKHAPAWRVLETETFVSANGATLTRQKDGSLFASGTRPERDTYTITADVGLPRLRAIRLEVIADERLPKSGPGRQPDNGNLHLSEIQAQLFEPGAETPRVLSLANVSVDFDQDGWIIRYALDGDEKTAWGIHPREGESHQAAFELATPLPSVPAGAKLVITLKQLHGGGHLIGRLRLAITDATPPIRVVPAGIERIAKMPAPERNEDQRVQLAAYVMSQRIANDLAQLPKPSMVFAAASDFPADASHKPAGAPREIHVLRRGEITKPLEVVSPGALTCVSALPNQFALEDPKAEGLRRAALARWLTHSGNPLTWRSIVNRVWQQHFGRGLVETVNDFGRMGSAPSHPELLDWLAVWFRDDASGSFKKLHRLIVTSATYRQAAATADVSRLKSPRSTKDKPQSESQSLLASAPTSDTDNLFLSRMNRSRLDAEQVRDAILLMSGRLDLHMGGPSDQQFDLQPGVHVTPKVDYTKFDVDSDTARRRSVYRFLFRTLPDPLMEALDCPAGDQLTPVRNNSVTVQQALALWNSAFTVRYAEHFATRLDSSEADLKHRITAACQWAWGRPPEKEEAQELSDYAQRHGLANLCHLLFNSNEFMFV
ncbi:MAG TPA: DUF1549 and DUF1553 domain-containing protein, partial [Verrucomicrobiae bacterium]|nr:DUF1549 and DUF1553 domain-containing protein [Verrucomicrobiae bacterium]